MLALTLLLATTLIATSSWAATPVSSTILLEAFAQLCDDGSCTVILDQETATDSDGQTTTLNPLVASIAATAGNQIVGPGANASLEMSAAFSSVSSGTIGFSGETGTRRPTTATSGCVAQNNLSDGFSYTFVASTDGFLTIDYDITCAPLLSTTALGNLEIYVDGTFWASAVASASIPTAGGTLQRPIQLGTTHTFRIRPNLNAISGSCAAPPGQSWTCIGGATWSFDAAVPAPSPAGSWRGALLVIGCLAAVGTFAMRRRPANLTL